MSNDKDTPKFQVYKYQEREGLASPYLDISDAYANNIETVLSFQYVPTGKVVYFKAFITALNESFNTSYKTETVFGRVDPIHTFSNIQRNMNFTFSIPAASSCEAFENLGNVQQLAQFMYPTYEDPTRANTISGPPLIRFKVMNIISSTPSFHPDDGGYAAPFTSYRSYAAALGLLGTLNNISVDHNLGGEEGVIEKGQNVVLPKLITVTCDFTVIHEEDLGWDAGGESSDVPEEGPSAVGADGSILVTSPPRASFTNDAFPYGAVLAETEVAPAADTAWDDAFENDAAIADLEADLNKTMNKSAIKEAETASTLSQYARERAQTKRN